MKIIKRKKFIKSFSVIDINNPMNKYEISLFHTEQDVTALDDKSRKWMKVGQELKCNMGPINYIKKGTYEILTAFDPVRVEALDKANAP